MPQPTHIVRFGPFELDLRSAELHHNGTKTKLPEQPFQVLCELVEHPGEVVTREELRQRLWSSDTFVDFEHGLNTAVKRLRELLGESAENPYYIETLPRHGYRLMVPVEKPELVVPAVSEASVRRRKTWLGVSVLIIAAATAGIIWRQRLMERFRPVKIESLAVLPLENLSGDPEEEYFADGMTEALITELGKVQALRVISRQSVMQYRGATKSVPQIARELHVDALVEGAALRSGNTVRITAQLVQINPERHLWSESYERDLKDVITLQREVTQAIAREIRVTLSPQEQQLFAKARPVSSEAYEAYLKGRYHFDRFSVEDIMKAREWFQRAIEKDPHYAPAYADLARTYTLSPGAWGGSVREAYETARGLTQKAIVIDGTLAEAHMVLAEIRREYDWDWASAEEESKRAISMNPSHAEAHAQYAALLSYLARPDEALREAKLALELDPVALYTNGQLGYAFYWAQRYDEAIAQFQKTLDLDRNYARAYFGLGRSYLGKGMPQEALETLKKGESLYSATGTPSGILGYAYGVLNQRSEALKIADQLKILRDQCDPDATFDLARVYTGLGDKDRALEFLQKAHEEHYPSMEVIRVDPQFDSLRADPRFQDLVRRMNFPH